VTTNTLELFPSLPVSRRPPRAHAAALPQYVPPRRRTPARNLELFPFLPIRHPCSFCRSLRFNPTCRRCESRRRARRWTDEDRELARIQVEEEQRLEEARERSRLARLRALRRPVHVVLVSCGKQKSATPDQARRFYTSPLSRLSMRYATAVADETFILSALHGLVPLDEVLEPYEFRLSQRGKRDREAWGRRIAAHLRSRYGTLPVRVTFLAGEDYTSAVRQFLPGRWRLAQPLSGLGLGKRVRWLNTALAALSPPAPSNCAPRSRQHRAPRACVTDRHVREHPGSTRRPRPTRSSGPPPTQSPVTGLRRKKT